MATHNGIDAPVHTPITIDAMWSPDGESRGAARSLPEKLNAPWTEPRSPRIVMTYFIVFHFGLCFS